MRQSWHDLLFLHAEVDPQLIQDQLPPKLQVDTFRTEDGQERAYIGLVAFTMSGIRPPGLPSLPYFCAFPELNVRTYVHHKGKNPGVWFFSLDAARKIACIVARQTFGLPYFHAKMSCKQQNGVISYKSKRIEKPITQTSLEYQRGERIGPANPGSFEFWLVERYLLYSVHQGQLMAGRVVHEPYVIHRANLLECRTDALSWLGLETPNWVHCCASPGVQVEVMALQNADAAQMIPGFAPA